MGMVLVVLGGFLAVILGILLLIFWFSPFIAILQGTIPLILILGGGIALFIGITEIKDTLKSKEEESKFDTFQEEPKVSETSEVEKDIKKEKEEVKTKAKKEAD